uniref:hypothetical protein n=1 Tax=Marinobacter sp. TaxID=50741 RepID=UPI0035C6758E
SGTTLLVVVVLYIFGGEVIKDFALDDRLVLYNLLARFAKSANAVEKELERQAGGLGGGSGLTASPQNRADDF